MYNQIESISLGNELVVNTVGTELVSSTFDGPGRSALSVASANAVGRVVSTLMAAAELVDKVASSQSRSGSLESSLDSPPDCSAEDPELPYIVIGLVNEGNCSTSCVENCAASIAETLDAIFHTSDTSDPLSVSCKSGGCDVKAVR